MGQNISAFRGAYDFLSNFYPAPITYNGLVFKNNEAAFQAAKCPERRAEFCCLNPSEAKRLGRRVKLRNDWDQIKDMVMYEICKAKFRQNPDLAERLISTSDFELIEGNNWGDHMIRLDCARSFSAQFLQEICLVCVLVFSQVPVLFLKWKKQML